MGRMRLNEAQRSLVSNVGGGGVERTRIPVGKGNSGAQMNRSSALVLP